MIKFILNSLLLLFFFGIVTASKDFDVIMGNKNFKTTKLLSAVYSQQVSDSSEGYHKAEFNLKTNLPSFNPDQSGVESVICKTEANGKRKIAFSLKDKKAVKDVKKWPERIMLLISHKWKCFGKRSTQFFTATDRVIDESKLVATFVIMNCDFPHNSEDYDINFNWVEGKQTKNNTHRSLEERFGISFPTINISNKISLNILFDSKSDKSSKPDISLINNNDIKLLCANCFTKGEATLALRIRGKIFPPKLKEASITLSGNFFMNLDLALEASKKISPERRKKASENSPIINFKTGDFKIPGLLELGPEIDLVAAADALADAKATLGFGGNFSLPNFSAKASFKGLPNFEQSGFNPIVNAHIPSASAKAFAIITATLKTQLGFGVKILKGRILNKKIGFELAGSLEDSFRLGSCKRKAHPHVKSSLGGNIGFFVNDKDFPILKFPTQSLLDKCL
ncbi:unnamed protein product [Rhizophagus irregularis]|uniref:DUF7223 domain-containing protein n=2 Tax=Rhizophagus irregularis TaxID=588596 RepID=A0A2N1N6K6_9GLOM|nr:hypothetical protein RhiirC2_712589 [Rhizophagus irregularis]CAB4388698.1 unnamed protein product [Rhizophagus irregularis]CAB5369317.1 unnamed protein product [Rhizophagus irregularis]